MTHFNSLACADASCDLFKVMAAPRSKNVRLHTAITMDCVTAGRLDGATFIPGLPALHRGHPYGVAIERCRQQNLCEELQWLANSSLPRWVGPTRGQTRSLCANLPLRHTAMLETTHRHSQGLRTRTMRALARSCCASGTRRGGRCRMRGSNHTSCGLHGYSVNDYSADSIYDALSQ